MSHDLERAIISMLESLASLFDALRKSVNAERGEWENPPAGEGPNPKKKKR